MDDICCVDKKLLNNQNGRSDNLINTGSHAMAVQFDVAPMTARCVSAVVTGCATILLSSAAWAAAPAAAPGAPAGYSSAPLLKLIAGTYNTGCEQARAKEPDSKRPGGSIQIAEDGRFSSGNLKGVFRDEVALLRSIEPNGGLNMDVSASDQGVYFSIDTRGKGTMYVAVMDDKQSVQCQVPVPQQLQAPTLFSLYTHVLDVEATLTCVKNGNRKKKYPLNYRVEQGMLHVFDHVFDLNKDNVEMIKFDTGLYGSNKFTYNARTRDYRTVDLFLTEGKFAGLQTYNNGKSYVCTAPPEAR